MEVIQKLVQFVIGIFKYHKLKLLIIAVSTSVFFVMLFPFSDLSDYVSSKVAQATNNQVYLSFEDMGVSLFPTLSAKLKGVSIETPNLPTIKAASLSAAPSIPALLTFSLGLSTKAEGFLNGEVSATVKQSKSEQERLPAFAFTLEGEELSSNELFEFLNVTTPAKGSLDFDFSGFYEPTLTEQPSVEFNIESAKGITLEQSNIPTPFGPLPFPKLTFSTVRFKGRLVNTDLILEEVYLGTDKDEMSAQVKGNFFLKLTQAGASIQPMFGRYSVSTRLNVKNTSKKSFELFLGFLDKYEKRAVGSSTYMFKAEGASFNSPPKLTPISSL